MKANGKRSLALLLVLLLCLGLLPGGALAGGSEDMPLELTVFDNNRQTDYGGGETDGYLELDEAGTLHFDVSAGASLSGPGSIMGVWLVDAATLAERYDLLACGGENQSAVESWEDENGDTVHFLNLYITNLMITGAAVGDYRLKVTVGSETLFSEEYADEYYATDGMAHVVAFGAFSGGPRITTSYLTPATMGESYSARLEATPENGGAITWSLASGSLPDGLTLSADGLISGTPTVKDNFNFTVRATEAGGGSSEKKLWLTVTYPLPRLLNPELTKTYRLPDGAAGVPYSFQCLAEPALAGDVLQWRIEYYHDESMREKLSWLTIDEATGLLSGTPTEPGEFCLTPYVFEPGTGNGTGPNVYLTVTGEVQDPPTITTESLPAGRLNEPYSALLTATPFTAGNAITWSLVSGRLPEGLTLSADGTISGTPTADSAGTRLTFRASETGGTWAEKTFTLVIVPSALSSTAEPTMTLSYVGELLRSEGWFTAVLHLNRVPVEGEELSGALEYTDREGAAQRKEYTLSRWMESPYASGYLPEDLAHADRFVFYLDGEEFAAAPVNADVAPTLLLRFEGETERGLHLSVYNAAGETILSQGLYGGLEPVTLRNLAPGTYTAELTGWVTNFGTLSFGSCEAALQSGRLTEAGLRVVNHESAYISPSVTINGSWCYYSCGWYADEACTQLLSTARGRAFLDDDEAWFLAEPTGSGSVEYTASTPLRVTRETAWDVAVPLNRKPMISVSVTASREKADGSGGYEDGEYFVTVARPGVNGYVDSRRDYGPAGEVFTAADVTEGTVISVTGRNAWYVSEDHATVSCTVTAADIAAGGLTKHFDIPLTEGRVYVDMTHTTPEGTGPYNGGDLRYLNVTVTKADGTELAVRRGVNVLTILEPEKLAVGETLTLYARNDLYAFGPTMDGSVCFAVEADAEGKKLARAGLELVDRRIFRLRLRRTTSGPMSLLVYRGDGSLLAKNDTLFAGSNASSTNLLQPLYGLLPDEYTFVLTDKRYLDTLAPESWDTAAEGLVLPYGGHVSADLRHANGEATITLTDADAAQEFSGINTELSSVTMTRASAGLITLDATIIPKPNFASEEGVTILVLTNQTGDAHGWGGFVGTRTLSVNGHPIDINRWESDYGSGKIGTDGTIRLNLTKEQVEAFGGFPLTLSTIFTETNFESVSCSAYLIYRQDGSLRTELVGSYAALTGGIRLEAPEATADGVFTLWGQGMPCTKNIQGYAADMQMDYNVTILADGVPVAQTKTNGVKGYFKAQIVLDAAHMEEYQEVEFIAVGAYDDGSFARVSAPCKTAYTPRDGVLHDFSLSWESHRGDYEAGRMQTIAIWEDGDPVNITSSWYRGAGSHDQARLFWTMHFENPEEITAVSIVVPRNGYATVIAAEKQEDGSWRTPLTYIPGSAPDGAWVTYETAAKYGVTRDPDARAHTEQDYIKFAAIMNTSPLIVDMEGDPYEVEGLSWYLSNGNVVDRAADGHEISEGILVTQRIIEQRGIPAEELAALADMEPVSADYPNLVYSNFGERSFAAAGGTTRTLYATDYVYRYDDPDYAGQFIYVREVTTLDLSVVTTYEPAKNRVTYNLTLLGDGQTASTAETEEDKLEEIVNNWLTYYAAYAEAAAQIAPTEALLNELEAMPDSSSLQVTKSGSYDVTSIEKAYNTINGVYKDAKPYLDLIKDSKSWQYGAEVTPSEAQKLWAFIADNKRCLWASFHHWESNPPTSGENNPLRIYADTVGIYYMNGIGEINKSLRRAVGARDLLNRTMKQIESQLRESAQKMVRDAAYDQFKTYMFDRQARNLARQLYWMCRDRSLFLESCDAWNWAHWPKDLYDPDDTGNNNPQPTSHTYDHYQQSPPGPQGRYDPSGFVYEAVPSNRVEGATVTLYTLAGDITEAFDESGVPTALSGGIAVPVDAEEFGVEPNPQTTGEDGRYQWFVPQGWWRVKVEAEGFEPADSGSSAAYGLQATRNASDGYYYMPVLPVQLDVNIPLVSFAAPEVESVSATPAGILLRFTKYMDETTLTAERFPLRVNGAPVDPTLSFPDSEAGFDGKTYARTVLLSWPGAAAGDEYLLTADNRVTSYAGVPMAEAWSSGTLTVAALSPAATPAADPAPGQVEKNTPVTLSCATPGAVIRYTVDGTEPTEESPLYTGLLFITEDITIKAAAFAPGYAPSAVLTAAYTLPVPEVIVPEAVTATVNGKPVFDGDTVASGLLRFATATLGADIWYTTNGVCPKEDPAPLFYDAEEPIELTPGDYFFRVRARLDGTWSDGFPLHLKVLASGDVNADGSVTRADAALIFARVSGFPLPVTEPTLDVNGDGKINNRDALLAFRMAMGG